MKSGRVRFVADASLDIIHHVFANGCFAVGGFHMFDGPANDFSVVVSPRVPIASGNERTAFEKSHGLLLSLKCKTIALSRE